MGGSWVGVKNSEDGGMTWRQLEIPDQGRIYGLVYNPYTDELIVSGRRVISCWRRGTGEDLRVKCGLDKVDFWAGPPLLDPSRKKVLVPVYFYDENGGQKAELFSYRSGKVEKLAETPAYKGDAVFAFCSAGKFYLATTGAKGGSF